MDGKTIKIIGWICITLVAANLILYGFLRNDALLWGVLAIAAIIAFPGINYLQRKVTKKTAKIR